MVEANHQNKRAQVDDEHQARLITYTASKSYGQKGVGESLKKGMHHTDYLVRDYQ
jgi:hypothetical protein